jgi:hypothetical protein
MHTFKYIDTYLNMYTSINRCGSAGVRPGASEYRCHPDSGSTRLHPGINKYTYTYTYICYIHIYIYIYIYNAFTQETLSQPHDTLQKLEDLDAALGNRSFTLSSTHTYIHECA